MSDFVQFEGVSRHYGAVRAVDDVTLGIRRGEFFSLLGPSGCGKTTLLRMLAGFERPDRGRVLLDGVDITELPPERRRVNTIFQNYALFPHLSVRENIAFGPTVAKRPRREVDDEVERMLALVQLGDHAAKRVDQISGGQKQRVAIARALINKPAVLLLDEPLAALDLKLRQRMLMELDLVHDQVGITFVFVTHDQGEAMSVADRVAVMNQGRIEQLGRPAEIYEAPQTSFVAAFIGDSNFFEGVVAAETDAEHVSLRIDGFPDLRAFNDKGLHAGDRVFLSVRPEKIRIAREAPAASPDHNVVRAVVDDVIYLGTHTRYWLRTGEYRLAVEQQHNRFVLDEKPVTWKDEVWLQWHVDDGYMLERYTESDEALMAIPPQHLGEGDAPGAPQGRG
ncbi:MAG: spermidine/putrescine import ATP-binding protein PotA [Candidatus Eisenbacteria bacterium]